MMAQQCRKLDDESQKAVDEFLAKGGKIQRFEYGKRSENVEYSKSFYGKKNKKADEE